jgi:hypothetical protein
VFSQQELGPAQRIVDYLNRECGSARERGAFPKRTFHRPKVLPEGGDKLAAVFRPTGGAPGGRCGVPWRGSKEDDGPARNETRGLNDYFPLILCHGCPHLFESRHAEIQCKRIVRTCIIVRP